LKPTVIAALESSDRAEIWCLVASTFEDGERQIPHSYGEEVLDFWLVDSRVRRTIMSESAA
jgi:hypothetical protein